MTAHIKGLSPAVMLETAKSIEKQLVKKYTLLALLEAEPADSIDRERIKELRRLTTVLRHDIARWRERAAQATQPAEHTS